MNIILLSGGSGKRLWPLSDETRSKQFIKFFKSENNCYESMLQRIYRQIKSTCPMANITVAAPKSQADLIKNQLGDEISISEEPCRKDTFPAIVLSAAYLHDVKGINENEAVAVCPVDPYVETAYFECLPDMYREAQNGKSSLVLMGIKPTYPSSKYGYIFPKSSEKASGVSAFKEKPDRITAEEYIKKGALWNGGVFAFKIGYLLQIAHNLIDFTDYNDLFSKYSLLSEISFDYAVVEKEKNITVIGYNGEWKDIGTWNTLTETLPENSTGKAVLSETCKNTHIINELDIPVLAMGLENIIICVSKNGILISDKHESAEIKPFVEEINEQLPTS